MQSRTEVKKPFILILYGYPGAGKTTFAKSFAAELQNAIHIDSKKVQAELGKQLKDINMDNPVAHKAIVEYMTKEYLKAGFSVILDTPVQQKTDRRKLRSLAAESKAKLVMVWLQIDGDSAYERLKKRDKRKTSNKYAKNYTRSEFESAINTSQNPASEDYVVISGKHTFHTQRSAVFKKLEEMGILSRYQVIQKKIKPELVNLIPQAYRGQGDLRRRDISIR